MFFRQGEAAESTWKVKQKKKKKEIKKLGESAGKKTIKLLHMYHDLMNLYGDWANMAVLECALITHGFEVVLDKKSIGDEFSFDTYDFIYIGSGTERSQIACMRDLEKYKSSFIERIEAGVPVLATGNSHELFGKAITDADGNHHQTLGLLDFETTQQNTRVTGDCVCTASFIQDKLIGFINRAGGSQQGDVERPFLVKPGEGAGFTACPEGIRYKNLLGTYLTGPVLVRNPPLLKCYTNILIGKTDDDVKPHPAMSYMEKAYETALSAM